MAAVADDARFEEASSDELFSSSAGPLRRRRDRAADFDRLCELYKAGKSAKIYVYSVVLCRAREEGEQGEVQL